MLKTTGRATASGGSGGSGNHRLVDNIPSSFPDGPIKRRKHKLLIGLKTHLQKLLLASGMGCAVMLSGALSQSSGLGP